MSIDMSEPAFPSAGVVIDYDKNEHQQGAYGGMSLRDYFAAKAYSAMIAGGYWPAGYSLEEQARMAYMHADAMLAARAQP